MRRKQDRVTRRKWATFSRALHGRRVDCFAIAETIDQRPYGEKGKSDYKKIRRMRDRVTPAQIGHIFAGVTRAGAGKHVRPYGEKGKSDYKNIRRMRDRVARRKWATFSRALHGRARQAVAPTGKKQKRLQKYKTNAGSRRAAQMGHIFAGVTRAGASIVLQSQRRLTERPYEEKGKCDYKNIRRMRDRVARRKWATFSRALHGRAQQASAPTKKKANATTKK